MRDKNAGILELANLFFKDWVTQWCGRNGFVGFHSPLPLNRVQRYRLVLELGFEVHLVNPQVAVWMAWYWRGSPLRNRSGENVSGERPLQGYGVATRKEEGPNRFWALDDAVIVVLHPFSRTVQSQ